MSGGDKGAAPVVTQKTVTVKPAGGATVKPDVPQCDKYEWDVLYDELRSISDMEALLATLHGWPVEALAYLYSPHLKDTRKMSQAERQRLRLAIHAVLYKKGDRDEAKDFQAELEAYTRGEWSNYHVKERAAITAYVHDDRHLYFTPEEYERVTPAASGSSTPLAKERFIFQYPGKATHAVLTEYKQKVYEAHVKWHKASGATFHALPKESLVDFSAAGIVGLRRKKPGEWADLNYPKEEWYSIQRDAANYLHDLLANARLALKEDADAKNVTAIGVSNAYRSAETDFGIWSGMFFGVVLSVIPRKPGEDKDALWALAKGKETGPALVQRMVDYYTAKPAEAIERAVGQYRAGKAAPGFSKHSDGKAVDFNTSQGGDDLGPSDSQHQAWMNSWFFIWLAKHARDFKFYPLSTEPWHWNFVP